MTMQKSKFLKFFLWLAGTLIVGALGNGLWEILKPALIWFSSAALDVATLGLATLRDGLYEEIARGTYERAGEKVLTIILGIFTGLPIGVLMVVRFRRAKNRAVGSEVRNQKPYRWAAMSFLIALAITLLIQNMRMIYIIRAANHMEQMQRVVAPLIAEQQRLIYASRFAAMHTREQYVALQAELTEIAKKNNVRVPVFDIY